MFKVIVHYDGHKYEEQRKSYEKAFELLKVLDASVARLRADAIIGDFYIELIKEVV